MLVQHRMTPNPVTVTPEMSFSDAFHLIREKKVRHLPVMDKKGKLIGIVTQKDLLHASPSSATALTRSPSSRKAKRKVVDDPNAESHASSN